MKRVGFQGESGAYSEAAAIAYFGEDIETVPCVLFDDVFRRIANAECDYGMLPIENSLAGSIHHNYDLLLRHELAIVGEHILRVEHCLIAHTESTLEEITTVTSHPQALAQCELFISTHGLAQEAAYDTAGSVKMLSETNRGSMAAIASRRAAAAYGMKVLAENIEDDPNNFTRFIAVGRENIETTASDGLYKTSLVFALSNVPGALFKALSVFAEHGINLTKIESRPVPGKPWEYLFYLDFTDSKGGDQSRLALSELGEIATFLRVFGSYPCALQS